MNSSHQSADGSLDTMSAFGTKQTSISTLKSAFPAKRTSLIGWPMSANDPRDRQARCRLCAKFTQKSSMIP